MLTRELIAYGLIVFLLVAIVWGVWSYRQRRLRDRESRRGGSSRNSSGTKHS